MLSSSTRENDGYENDMFRPREMWAETAHNELIFNNENIEKVTYTKTGPFFRYANPTPPCDCPPQPFTYCYNIVLCAVAINGSVVYFQQTPAMDGYDNQGMLRSELNINGNAVNSGNTW